MGRPRWFVCSWMSGCDGLVISHELAVLATDLAGGRLVRRDQWSGWRQREPQALPSVLLIFL
jgi:hypothetical protein